MLNWISPLRRHRRWSGRSSGILLLLLVTASSGLAPHDGRAQPVLPIAEEEYQDAYRLFMDRLFASSVDAFRDFRESHPESAHAPDAMYYEAASALGLGRSDEAAVLFERFNTRYPAHPLRYEAKLALGRWYFDTGDYRGAIDNFQQVLDTKASYDLQAKSLFWMGEAAAADGDLDEAIRYYRRAADDFSASSSAPIASYAEAYTELSRDNYEAASRALERLAERHPGSRYARDIGLGLAEVYYELEDYPRAVAEINRRLPVLQGDAQERATFMLAESYNQLRRSDEAILNYRKFTEENPESPYFRQALFGLGWNYQSAGAHEWAADEFAKAGAGFSDLLAQKALYYQAANLKMARQERRAIERYKEVVDRWPSGPYADKALFELGITYYQLRQWSDANQTFKKLVDDYRSSSLLDEGLNRLGSTYIALGDFEGALKAFNQAIERNAAEPELRAEIEFQKAWLLFRSERYSVAVTALIDLYETYPSHPRAEDALFWAAESYYQLNRLGPASDLFGEYLETYPDGKNVDAAHYAIGWTHFRRGSYDAAATEFDRFLESYRDETGFVPYRHDARLRLADSYYALKRYPDAVRIYSRLADDGDEYAIYQMAQALANSGRTFEATGAFRRLIADYPDSDWREESEYSLGYLFFQNQEYDNARKSFRDLISQSPRDPLAAKALYSIGDTYFNDGDLEGSIREYKQVLERYPNSPFASDAAASIQFALMAIGEEDRAVALIDSFAAAHPNSPVIDDLRFKQAEVKYQSGRTDDALSDFQVFVRNALDQKLLPEAYYYLGAIFLERKQDVEAESYLKQLFERFDRSSRWPDAARNLGNLYLRNRRYEEALTVFKQLEDRAGDNKRQITQARYGQSVALMNLGRLREAERLVKRTVDDAPDSPESVPALLGLAQIYDREDRVQEADAMYRRVVSLSRDESGAEALTRLGQMLLRTGNPRSAIEELGRTPILYSGFAEWIARGYMTQGKAFEQLGERGEAARMYDTVIDQYPGSGFADEARRAKDNLQR
ncbi:MAG: tetratricopeptide repeat protein [Rhodothermales bacterium]|nr:tetratricopeptide repeat protein [Rhodothermales bacterium]